MASAKITGFVSKSDLSSGSIEVAGLMIHLDKGVSVQVNELVEVDCRLDESGRWSGVLLNHLHNPASRSLAAMTPAQMPGSAPEHKEADPATAPAASPVPAKERPVAAAAHLRSVANAPHQAGPTSAPAPAQQSSGISRAARFASASSSSGPAQVAKAPAHAHAPAPQRPAFLGGFDDMGDVPF